MKLFFRNLILRFLGLENIEERMLEIERHFVTKRDKTGVPTETLADVPLDQRKSLKRSKAAGLSWSQRQAYLEATDGGTRAVVAERIPSTS
jgi:hypothetical protein